MHINPSDWPKLEDYEEKMGEGGKKCTTKVNEC